jgi:hypothetical protein
MQHTRAVSPRICRSGLLLIGFFLMINLSSSVKAEPSELTFQEGVNGYMGTVDTFIMENEPADPHGTLPSLEWDTDDPSGSGKFKFVLTRFENIFGSAPNQIPVGAIIQSATLTYTVFDAGNLANVNEVSVDWPGEVTWNDFGSDPGVQADEYGNFVGTAFGSATGTYSIDVTASLSGWAMNPSANRGWIFRPTGTDGVDFRSSEYATAGSRPRLVVNFEDTVTLPPYPPVLNGPPDGATGIANWPVLDVHVSDPEADDMTVTFWGREISASIAETFSIILLPDTQIYSELYPDIFADQTRWVVQNKDALNIVYVAHEGDIVNTANSIDQWGNADAAMSLLEDPTTTGLDDGIPYGVLPGNHDLPLYTSPTYYSDYFGTTRFNGRGYYGGAYMQLKAFTNRRGIIVSHSILNEGGTQTSWTSEGQSIFNALSDNPNLFLTLCGHMHGEGRRTDTGTHGNTIYSLLADYQDRTLGGNGLLRILEFMPSENVIIVKTYSPWTHSYETDGDSRFVLDYDMSPAFEVVGSNPTVASDSNTTMDWQGLKPFTEYEWYVTVTDGVRTVTGPVWSFITGGLLGDLNGDCDVDGSDLSEYIRDDGGESLADFSNDFGKNACL